MAGARWGGTGGSTRCAFVWKNEKQRKVLAVGCKVFNVLALGCKVFLTE